MTTAKKTKYVRRQQRDLGQEQLALALFTDHDRTEGQRVRRLEQRAAAADGRTV